MKLSDAKLKGLRPQDSIYRIADGEVNGLSIEVRITGSRCWRFRFKKPDGKYSMISLGEYPEISLAKAREIARSKRSMLAQGMDITRNSDSTFKSVFEEWHSKNSGRWSEEYADSVKRRVESNLLPWIGNKHTSDITGLHLLCALEKIENRGAVDTAHRVLQYSTAIFSYAISKRLIDRNPALDIKGALTPSVKKSYPAPTDPQRIGEILQAIDKYSGSFTTVCALKMLTLTMLRPGELRNGHWSEIDWQEKLWIIPGDKMKCKKNERFKGKLDHIVPLCKQAMTILEELYPVTSKSIYIFPAEHTKLRPMSENTMNVAFRRMGFTQDEIVSHSFRSIASTLLNEREWPSAWIEKQLAHIDQNKVRGVYNRAEYLPQRRRMLQEWANFLDYLREGGTDANGLRAGQNLALVVNE